MHIDTSKAFKEIQAYLHSLTGIYLDNSKQTMMKNRLDSLKQFPIFDTITSASDLIQLINKNTQAKQLFINAFTTNQTDFFRERVHFQDMLDRVLPTLFRNQFSVKIYCAASSTGEEPYSIAATVLYACALYNSSCHVEIYASDIDTKVLQQAKDAIFTLSPSLSLPHWVDMERYFDILQIATNGTKTMRAKTSLRKMVKFFQLNLHDASYPFHQDEFDIIFCRNVLIYFQPAHQELILSKLLKCLKKSGTLYIGHADDILGLKSQVERLGNKTYIKL